MQGVSPFAEEDDHPVSGDPRTVCPGGNAQGIIQDHFNAHCPRVSAKYAEKAHDQETLTLSGVGMHRIRIQSIHFST